MTQSRTRCCLSHSINWSQDRGSYTKTNRGRTRSEKNKIRQTNSEEIRQKEAGVEVACKGHYRQEGI